MKKYYSKEEIAKIKEIDLLTYLKKNDPNELIYCGRETYQTVTHDSLKISNGMWYWFSRGIGGNSALDYLIQVREKTFLEAMEMLSNNTYEINTKKRKEKEQVKLILPFKNNDSFLIKEYLINRGIDEGIIQQLIDNDIIYQEKNTQNVVFVGCDHNNEPRYISLRGIKGTRYFKEARGSNKAFSFKLVSENKQNELHLFESAIDVLSYATLLKIKGKDWWNYNLLSLAGIYKPARDINDSKLPSALSLFLNNNSNIKKLVLHLDNDEAGRLATTAIITKLKNRYEVIDSPPTSGKDVNDFLLSLKYKHKNNNLER